MDSFGFLVTSHNRISNQKDVKDMLKDWIVAKWSLIEINLVSDLCPKNPSVQCSMWETSVYTYKYIWKLSDCEVNVSQPGDMVAKLIQS